MNPNTLNPKISKYLQQYADARQFSLFGPMDTTAMVVEEPVIFVDGGSKWREDDIGISVGDGDSFADNLDYKLNPEKDFSDLGFALQLVPESVAKLQLNGFLGGRKDHELLNLGEVFHYLKTRIQPTEVWFEQEVTAVSSGDWTLNLQGIFSLITFAPSVITLRGQCKYKIQPDTIVDPVSSFGLSNEGFGEVHIHTDMPVFIFHNHPESA